MSNENIQLNGKDQIIEMFDFADDELKYSILESIQKRNPKLHQELRARFVKFEDLLKLDLKDFQTLLKNIPKKQLMLSMRLASLSFKQKTYQCVSDRQIEEIESYLTVGAKESVSRVKKEQEKIVNIAKQLIQRGMINLKPQRKDLFV